MELWDFIGANNRLAKLDDSPKYRQPNPVLQSVASLVVLGRRSGARGASRRPLPARLAGEEDFVARTHARWQGSWQTVLCSRWRSVFCNAFL